MRSYRNETMSQCTVHVISMAMMQRESRSAWVALRDAFPLKHDSGGHYGRTGQTQHNGQIRPRSMT